MLQFPSSGGPGAPISQGISVPLSNVGYGGYPQTQLFANTAYTYPSTPNLMQQANIGGSSMATVPNMQSVQPAAGGQQPGMGAALARPPVGSVMGLGQGPNTAGVEKRRAIFQQILTLLFQTNTMSKEEVERLMLRGQDVKDEDLMTCLKDAVGNEQLAGALKMLYSGQQRKPTGLPGHPQDGFMQRGPMAGVGQTGMPRQHLSQLQVQPMGGMRRPISQQHSSMRDLARQPPIVHRQEPLSRHGSQGGMGASYPVTGQHQRPHVIGIASSGPAVGMPLSVGMPSSGRFPPSYPLSSVGYQTQTSLQMLPGASMTPGTGQVPGLTGTTPTGTPPTGAPYQGLVSPNTEWNRVSVQNVRSKDPLLHTYAPPAHAASQWSQPRTAPSPPSGHPYMVQQTNVHMQSLQGSKPTEPQVGDKRPPPQALDSGQKRAAVDAEQSLQVPRPKPRRPIEDPNAPDVVEGDVIRGAAIELADEQEALLGQFRTLKQPAPEQAAKGVTAQSAKSWVNSEAVKERLDRVLRQKGIAGMSPDCVEAMVRGIELKFDGMIKKYVAAARHRKPVTEGQRGIEITSDVRGKLREARKAEAEKQASKERAERAKLEKLAETATQTATKRELAGNKELAAKVEKVKRERILSAEAAAANRALSMAFGGLGFEKFRKMKREKEAAEKAKEEEERAQAEKKPKASDGGADLMEITSEDDKQDVNRSGDLMQLGEPAADKKMKSGKKEPEKTVIRIQVNDLLGVLHRDPYYARSKELQKLYLHKR